MVTPGTPPIPHVGGPITGPGVPTVLIGGVPAAVMGDMCTCVGPPDTIVLGSTGVFIGGKPAARMGDQCAHGGTIVVGCPTVLIGEAAGGGGGGISVMPVNVLLEVMNMLPPKQQQQAAQIVVLKEAAANGYSPVNMNVNSMEDVMQQRKDIAKKFYKDNNPQMTDEQVSSHVNGIDLTHPVLIVEIPPEGDGPEGRILYQYQKMKSNGEILTGKYFTNDNNATPSMLGISDKYNVPDENWNKTDAIKTVEKTVIEVVPPPKKALKSISKKIDDTWSLKNDIVATEGGATQMYIPKF